MKKIRVGLLTLSDGRIYLHEEYKQLNFDKQHAIAAALTETGLFEVVEGTRLLNSNAVAKEEAIRLRESGVEVTIFNYSIWCYPQFTVVAQNFAPGPYLLFSNLHPSQCGMVGMLAAAGSLDQLGVKYARLWGDVADETVKGRMVSFLKAAAAVSRLRGLTFGNFGGRPLGMYTAVANLEQWQKQFGIDVENIEQGATVKAYQIVQANYNSNGFIGYSPVEINNLTVEDAEKPTSEEVADIAAYINSDAYEENPLKEAPLTDADSDGVYTGNLNPGYWVVLVRDLKGAVKNRSFR